MNRSKVKKLHGILAERNPDAEVAVIPQQEGVKVVISGSDFGAGVSVNAIAPCSVRTRPDRVQVSSRIWLRMASVLSGGGASVARRFRTFR